MIAGAETMISVWRYVDSNPAWPAKFSTDGVHLW